MINIMAEMFSYTFLARAAIVGAMVALCAALLGTSLVLKRYSMIGDGLSHVGFGALAVATAFGWAPLAVSIPLVLLAAFLLLRISASSKIKGDAAIAMIATGSLAVGVIILSITTGMTTDVCNYMFGSILAMNKYDVYMSIILSIFVFILFLFFYHQIFSVTFDEVFAKATGVKVGTYNTLIAMLTAVTIVLGMRMMGTMLISSFIVFPSLTAMRLCKTYRSVVFCAVIISLLSFSSGLILSYMYELPTGASVVVINILGFLFFSLIGFLKGRGRVEKI